MPVIDVHTHMLNQTWLELIRQYGAPRYTVVKNARGSESIMSDGTVFLTPFAEHMDYKIRIKDMDDGGVDIAIVSLTGMNCFFGPPEISLKCAQVVNDEMAEAQRTWPDRIRFLASIPFEHPDLAVPELKRAHQMGAVGVMVMANINGRHLTDPLFAPVWQAIDDLALPVLVHPSTPPGAPLLQIGEFNLAPALGFMIDTSLAVARLILSGFLDKYPNLKIIASHAGATLPYIIGRIDKCYEAQAPFIKPAIPVLPSEYMSRIYYDAVTYRMESLQLCIQVGGEDNIMYGSDYPHSIGDMKGCLHRVNALSPRVRDKARYRNAERIFRL